MTADEELLREFTLNGSESAFSELVNRYINLVYMTALRYVRDPRLAEDVTQIVFINFAKKAAGLAPRTILAGWLHRDTHFASLDLLRKERRRQRKDLQAAVMAELNNATGCAWNEVRPLIDALLERLDSTDKSVVLLRYFEQLSIREVSTILGISEVATAKRLQRSIEKLRSFLAAKGVKTTADALCAGISANMVGTAPLALAPLVALKALSAVAIGSHSASVGLHYIFMAKLKTFVAAAALAAAVAIPILVENQLVPRIRTVRARVSSQEQELASLRTDLGLGTGLLNASAAGNRISSEELNAIKRLRNQLQQQAQKESETALRVNPSKTTDTSALPPGTIPRNAYLNKGFGTPAATVQTRFWAIASGNISTWLESFIPESRKVLEPQFEDLRPGITPDGFKNGLTYKATGFRILGQSRMDSGDVIVKVYFEGEDAVTYERMTPIQSSWKITPGGDRQAFLLATPLPEE